MAAKKLFRAGVSQYASDPDDGGSIQLIGNLNLKAGIETRDGNQVLEIENNWYAVRGYGRPSNRTYSASGGTVDTFPPHTYGDIPFTTYFKLATPGAPYDLKGEADLVVTRRSREYYSARVLRIRLKSGLDEPLREILANNGITPLVKPVEDPDQVELGRMLFNDKLLGGNRDTSCATCHLHGRGTGDLVELPAGTLGIGLGPDRVLPEDRHVVGRNTQPLFNLKFPEITTQFWDIRVVRDTSPNAFGTFPEFTHVLDQQAILPIIVDDEMLGEPGDLDVFGNPNEMALAGAGPPPPIGNGGPPAIWAALMARLLGPDGSVNSPTYPELFEAAFPGAAHDIRHVGLAIAAYESDAFTLLDSPWDKYVAGDDSALNATQKKGALLFYNDFGCAQCHSGNLFSDQKAHNILVPQLGPGKFLDAPDDFGFGGTPGPAGTGFGTGLPEDKYKFRTPFLRNVRATGPWMHDGAFTTLEATVWHHFNPQLSFLYYDESQLAPEFQDTVKPHTMLELTERMASFDATMIPSREPNPREFYELMSFLYALTSPSIDNLNDEVPDEVPSGLPVDELQ